MIAKKKTLSELAKPVTIFPQVLKNVRVTDKVVARNDEDVQVAVDEVRKILGDDGRILVRESGTEPVVRVMVEAKTHEICEEQVEKVVNVLKEKGYIVG